MTVASVAFRVTAPDDHFRSFGTAIADGDPKPDSESKRFPFHRSTPFDDKTWTVDCRKRVCSISRATNDMRARANRWNTLSGCPHAARRVGHNSAILRVLDGQGSRPIAHLEIRGTGSTL